MNTNTTVLAVAVVLALAVVGYFGWLFVRQEAPVAPSGAGEGQEFSPPTAVYEEQGDTFVVHAIYPDIPVVKDAVLQIIAEFKEIGGFESLTPQDIEIQRLDERKYQLEITYDSYASGEYRSYVLTIYTDTLGAHPNAAFRTFTFNGAGEEVELEDLFMPEAQYLPRISQRVYEGVITQLEARTGAPVAGDAEDAVRIGTSPTSETLQFFYLAGEDLHIIIPPYQAAAWAAGYFDIPVPLAAFQDILK